MSPELPKPEGKPSPSAAFSVFSELSRRADDRVTPEVGWPLGWLTVMARLTKQNENLMALEIGCSSG